MMAARTLTLITIAGSMLFSCGSKDRPQCGSVENYFFAADQQEIAIENGAAQTVELTFYPTPDAKMAFHAEQVEQLSLASSQDVYARPKLVLPDRTSDVFDRIFGRDAPLIIPVTIERSEQEGSNVTLDFGGLGKIDAVKNETVSIRFYLYPATCPSFDSQDGFQSDELTISVK